MMLDEIARIVHTEGALTRVLAGFPTDEVEAQPPGPRLRSLIRDLHAAGSPDSDIATVLAALEQPSADRNRTARYLLVRDGELLVDDLLPDLELGADETSCDQLPALIPLLEQRQWEVPYVLLEASAGGGRIRTFLGGKAPSDTDERVTGETRHLHEAHGGGLSHFRNAHHTEEVWKRNETELAEIVNRLVQQNEVSLVVVTGDPHVVDLVSRALSSRAQTILATLTSDTVAAGASPDELNELLADQRQRLVREHQLKMIDRADAQQRASKSAIDRRLQPIVHALQQAGVQALLLDVEGLHSHELLALAGEPWVAAVASETFGAAILGTVPAAEALARAALATGAEVVLVAPNTLAGHAGAAFVHH